MEMLVSFAQNREDIILAHVLSGILPKDIFWIDVGANDPVLISVTALFYLRGGRGVNIEPQIFYKNRYKDLRQRDINLFVGISDHEGEMLLSGRGDTASFEKADTHIGGMKIPVITLNTVFEKNVPEGQEVHFLKIDVEGHEAQCLAGLNLAKYRPWILCIEYFGEEVPEWEPQLLENDYRYVYRDRYNKYYVSGDKSEIIDKFREADNLNKMYEIVSVQDATKWMAYEESTSWRITEPLRKLAGTIGCLKKALRRRKT